MKTITTTLALILGLAIGGFAGNYYGKAQVLERMVMQTTESIVGLK
jgi:ABC-type dipeptide/oligopeptide/nickel transport system permease subunit